MLTCLPPSIPDAAGLRGASWRVVFRVKVKDDGQSLEICEFQSGAGTVFTADGS